jgi:protein TonB
MRKRENLAVGIAALIALAGGPVMASEANPAQPQAIVKVQPRYPADALAQAVEGRARVTFRLDERGAVRDVITVHETPPGLGFGTEAAAAVHRWRFESAFAGQYAVDVVFLLPE